MCLIILRSLGKPFNTPFKMTNLHTTCTVSLRLVCFGDGFPDCSSSILVLWNGICFASLKSVSSHDLISCCSSVSSSYSWLALEHTVSIRSLYRTRFMSSSCLVVNFFIGSKSLPIPMNNVLQ